MPVTFNPVGDFADVCDGLESITLSARSDGTGSNQATASALRRAVGHKEAQASNGLYTSSDVVWHLPQEDITTPPALGDVIIDNDLAEWTILARRDDTLSDRWRCVTRNLVASELLTDLVTIQVAYATVGDTGAHETTWSDMTDALRGRIQRAFTRSSNAASGGARVISKAGTRTLEAEYTLFIRERVELKGKHRIVDQNGNRYLVTGYRDPERIDKLTEVDLVPWIEDYTTGAVG